MPICLCNCINSFIHMFSISRLCGNFSRFCGNLRNQRFGFSRFCCKLIKWISVFYIYSDPYEGLFLEHGISNKGKLFIWKLVTVQFHMFILDALSHWNMESSVQLFSVAILSSTSCKRGRFKITTRGIWTNVI